MKLKQTKLVTLAATLITFGSLAGGANAAVILNIFNDGTKVTISSSGGTVDLSGMTLTDGGIGFGNELFHGTFGLVGVEGSDRGDSTSIGNLAYFNGFTRGNDSNTSGSFSSGDQTIAIREIGGAPGGGDDTLFFPTGWTAGINTLNAFRFTTTSDTDVTSLGYTNNSSAVWTATSGDTVTILVGSIPEPSSAILMGLGALGFVVRRRRTK